MPTIPKEALKAGLIGTNNRSNRLRRLFARPSSPVKPYQRNNSRLTELTAVAELGAVDKRNRVPLSNSVENLGGVISPLRDIARSVYDQLANASMEKRCAD